MKKATPGNEPSNTPTTSKESGGVRGLIKTGFSAQIHVSYDRIEPETGESENVAVVDSVGGAGGAGLFGRGKQGVVPLGEVGGASMESRESEMKEDGRENQQSSVASEIQATSKGYVSYCTMHAVWYYVHNKTQLRTPF